MIFGPRVEGCTARPIKSDRMAICGYCCLPAKTAPKKGNSDFVLKCLHKADREIILDVHL